MVWKQSYAESSLQGYQRNHLPITAHDFTYKGSLYVIVNTASHVAESIAKAQTILVSSRADSDVDRRRDELNAHLFTAVIGVQSLCDSVAAACNLKSPRITGDVSFFPGTEREYHFVTKENLSLIHISEPTRPY